MIVDLHAHYPMHIVPHARGSLWRLLRTRSGRRRLRDHLRALLVGLASLVANYRSLCSGPRVLVKYMRAGRVGVALSVTYSFFDEIDLVRGPAPHGDYLETLEAQIRDVESHVREKHASGRAVVAHNPGELEEARRSGALALIHCIEGGFHLGPDPTHVDAAIERLSRLGVAYVTLAHLIYRGVATDAPALPFMSDDDYRQWFPQPAEGLSELGRAAARAMVRHRVLIDIAHMSEAAVGETFALLDELDPEKSVPVVATHAGYRFGAQEYMLTPQTIARIGQRDGLIGLIFATHQLQDGLPKPKGSRLPVTARRRFDRSVGILSRHIDCICEAAGSHRHTAIGSDFDGFIKPTLPGIQDMRDMARLEAALLERYGEADGERICSGNALRVLGRYWRGNAEAVG